MSARPERSRSAWPTVGRVIVGVLLFLYALLIGLIASAWGPGNYEAIVDGGLLVVPWYGLPLAALIVAIAGLAMQAWPRRSWIAYGVAALLEATWTIMLFAIPD